MSKVNQFNNVMAK